MMVAHMRIFVSNMSDLFYQHVIEEGRNSMSIVYEKKNRKMTIMLMIIDLLVVLYAYKYMSVVLKSIDEIDLE